MNDTPETDAAWDDMSVNVRETSKRLERERDEARQLADRYLDFWWRGHDRVSPGQSAAAKPLLPWEVNYFINSDTDTETTPEGAVDQQRFVRHLLDALQRISGLKAVTQTRGPMEHLGTPEHLIDPEGWGPIQPAVKTGLCIAARIADEALNSLPNDQIHPR